MIACEEQALANFLQVDISEEQPFPLFKEILLLETRSSNLSEK